MKNPARPVWILGILLVAVALLAACGPQPTAAVSEDYVRELAEQKMLAINNLDYETFIQDYSEKLQGAFPEEKFVEFSQKVLASSGKFESITGSRLATAQTRGYVQYIYSCKHENENVTLTLVYEIDGEQVEGIFFNGPKLNQILTQ